MCVPARALHKSRTACIMPARPPHRCAAAPCTCALPKSPMNLQGPAPLLLESLGLDLEGGLAATLDADTVWGAAVAFFSTYLVRACACAGGVCRCGCGCGCGLGWHCSWAAKEEGNSACCRLAKGRRLYPACRSAGLGCSRPASSSPHLSCGSQRVALSTHTHTPNIGFPCA